MKEKLNTENVLFQNCSSRVKAERKSYKTDYLKFYAVYSS